MALTTNFQRTWLQGVVDAYHDFVRSTPETGNTAEIVRLGLMEANYSQYGLLLKCEQQRQVTFNTRTYTRRYVQLLVQRFSSLGTIKRVLFNTIKCYVSNTNTTPWGQSHESKNGVAR